MARVYQRNNNANDNSRAFAHNKVVPEELLKNNNDETTDMLTQADGNHTIQYVNNNIKDLRPNEPETKSQQFNVLLLVCVPTAHKQKPL